MNVATSGPSEGIRSAPPSGDIQAVSQVIPSPEWLSATVTEMVVLAPVVASTLMTSPSNCPIGVVPLIRPAPPHAGVGRSSERSADASVGAVSEVWPQPTTPTNVSPHRELATERRRRESITPNPDPTRRILALESTLA